MSCNVNDYELVNEGILINHHRLKLDQDTATDLAVAGGAGAMGVQAIGSAIAYAVSGIANPISMVFATIIIVEAARVQIAADGCGITIDLYMVQPDPYIGPDPTDIPYHTINSQ